MQYRTRLMLIADLLSLIGIIALMTVCSPCSEGMVCVKSTEIVINMLLILSILNTIKWRIKSKTSIILTIIELAGYIGLLVYDIPMCKMETMRCNILTLPCIRITAISLAIITFITLVFEYNEKHNKKESDIQ